MAFPGVGATIADLTMQHAWKEVEGIPIDLKVHQVANRLQWVGMLAEDGQHVDSLTPFETKEQLEKWLPKERWSEVGSLFRAFSHIICKKDLPDCVSCKIKDLCPSKEKC